MIKWEKSKKWWINWIYEREIGERLNIWEK